MWDAIKESLSAETGLLAVVIGAAWRYFLGARQQNVETRIREAAAGAWHIAKAATGYNGLKLHAEARTRALDALHRIGIPIIRDEVRKLVEHELMLLLAHDLAAAIPAQLGELHKAATGIVAAFEAPPPDARKVKPLDPAMFEVTVICPEPGCAQREGHAGAHDVDERAR